jgi:ComF family protein
VTVSPVAHKLKALLQPLYSFLYPPVCFSCDTRLNDSERKVCETCWVTMMQVTPEEPACRQLLSRLREEGNVDLLISTYSFHQEGKIQTLIHKLKYDGATSLGIELGRRVGPAVQAVLSSSVVAGLVPVPLHSTKLRERGYNQSVYICKGISQVTGLSIFSLLLDRVRPTRSQTLLNIEERKANVRDAFAVNRKFRDIIRDQTFIVVDDVITTGATIGACAHVLKEHGAKSVIACSVALAP